MRNDSFFWTVAAVSVVLACAGVAARSTDVAVAGRVVREGFRAPEGAKGVIKLVDLDKRTAWTLKLECDGACTFRGAVPQGRYRVTMAEGLSLPGHTALLREQLTIRGPELDLRFEVPAAITVSGTLSDGDGSCPARLASVTFRRAPDGEEFGAAVTCASGGSPGFAALLEPGQYDVKVDLPDGRAFVAKALQLRTDVVDLPLAVLLPAADARFARF